VKAFHDVVISHQHVRLLDRLERCSAVVAAYIGAVSRGWGLDQSGGVAGFGRSGNSGVRSREARVIVAQFTSVDTARRASEGHMLMTSLVWNSPAHMIAGFFADYFVYVLTMRYVRGRDCSTARRLFYLSPQQRRINQELETVSIAEPLQNRQHAQTYRAKPLMLSTPF